MKLKIRTHQDTLEEVARTVSFIPDIDPDIVSGSIMHNHNRYYRIATLNNIAEWSYTDHRWMFHKKYNVAS